MSIRSGFRADETQKDINVKMVHIGVYYTDKKYKVALNIFLSDI